jgi:short-subunit dehydrogenase
MELRGARALVTGASSGIGTAVAETLVAAGAVLALSGRRADVLEALADRLGARGPARPAVLPADLAVVGAAGELAAQATAALGAVDVLVNSAGAFETGPAAADDPTARTLLETNYWAPMALASALLPGMRRRGAGAVVNMSSISVVTPLPAMSAYPASKAALTSATEALRLELAGSGVHVVLAFLGGVDTPMHARASRPYGAALRRMPVGRPEVAARRIVDAIRRGRPLVVYPRGVAALRWFPAASAWISARVMLPLLLGRPVAVTR